MLPSVIMSGSPSPLKSLQYAGVVLSPEAKLPLALTEAAEVLLPLAALDPCELLPNFGFILMAMALVALFAFACCSSLIFFANETPASIVAALDSDCGSGTSVCSLISLIEPVGFVNCTATRPSQSLTQSG